MMQQILCVRRNRELGPGAPVERDGTTAARDSAPVPAVAVARRRGATRRLRLPRAAPVAERTGIAAAARMITAWQYRRGSSTASVVRRRGACAKAAVRARTRANHARGQAPQFGALLRLGNATE